jgi:hypothetical protein
MLPKEDIDLGISSGEYVAVAHNLYDKETVEGPRSLYKVIYMPPPSDPIIDLLSLVHEVRHGCDMQLIKYKVQLFYTEESLKKSKKDLRRISRLEKRLDRICSGFLSNDKIFKCLGAYLKLEREKERPLREIIKETQQLLLVDEVRVRSVELAFWAEIAQASPKLICSYPFLGYDENDKFYIESISQIYKKTEEIFRDGTIAFFVAITYIDNSSYALENIFNSQGVMYLDIMRKLRKARNLSPYKNRFWNKAKRKKL